MYVSGFDYVLLVRNSSPRGIQHVFLQILREQQTSALIRKYCEHNTTKLPRKAAQDGRNIVSKLDPKCSVLCRRGLVDTPPKKEGGRARGKKVYNRRATRREKKRENQHVLSTPENDAVELFFGYRYCILCKTPITSSTSLVWNSRDLPQINYYTCPEEKRTNHDHCCKLAVAEIWQCDAGFVI